MLMAALTSIDMVPPALPLVHRCTYVCIYVYMYICVYTYTSTAAGTWMYICIYVYMYIYSLTAILIVPPALPLVHKRMSVYMYREGESE